MYCFTCGSTDFSICNDHGSDKCDWITEEQLEQLLIEKWCNTHQRDYKRCSTEGGIMLPCRPIICKEVGIEIWDDKK